jgi:hypothetical protein
MDSDGMDDASTKAGEGPPLRGSPPRWSITSGPPPRQPITLKNGFDFLPNFVIQGSA